LSEPTEPSSASYETQSEAQSESDLLKQWNEATELAGTEEKEWRESALEADLAYAQGKNAKKYTFNIWHANVETLIPALRNSTAVPDIRPRHNFGTPDPIAKLGCDILERCISASIDDCDFDDAIDDGIQDMGITGRGIARVVYEPQTGDVQGIEDVVNERLSTEHVGWAGFRHGPAKTWSEVPWIAFPHFLGREAIIALAGPEIGKKVKLDLTVDSDAKRAKQDKAPDSIFKRTLVYEVWDKDKREVFFFAPCYLEQRLKVIPDPLGLEDFFPIPRPMVAAHRTGSLTPVCLYVIYEELLDELDVVTKRIRKLVGQLRPRGIGPESADLKSWVKAGDGEIVGLSEFAQFLDTPGGFEKLIAWFPMDPTANAVKVLYEQRESIKQQIFEVSGLADIMRGQTNPNETKGAQDLKAQWGSLRINRRQQEVQRFIRDIFRIKAEIIAKKFAPQTLALMSGLAPPPPQPNEPQEVAMQKMQAMQTWEQALALLKQDPLRRYRIDVETDSTIRGDISRNMEQMTQFVQGSGAFFQAMAPAVESGALPMEAAITIYSSFARQFRLGKEVEDLLDRLGEQAKQPQQPKPDPEAAKAEAEKAKMEMQGKLAEAEKAKMEMQGKLAEQKAALEQQKGEHKIAIEGQKLELEKQKHQSDIQFKTFEMMIDKQAAELKMAIERQMGQQKLQIQGQQAERDGAIQMVTARQDMELNRENAHAQQGIARNKAQADAQIAAFKARQQAKQKPARS
jgi:hypothetical protein